MELLVDGSSITVEVPHVQVITDRWSRRGFSIQVQADDTHKHMTIIDTDINRRHRVNYLTPTLSYLIRMRTTEYLKEEMCGK
ncbi:hypothetical protein KP509_21G020900 [Ceratopteris richardii]|uniref:Uncharacterized protein n=1 Tax=Ceratopteris richardii TaxID=49495 RepID=A0A8T2S892_CERRI|nr:hypothetical protein KP509_21G020900 [Ceratopteris richardii]